jgi:hypothetical protein
MGVGAKVGTGVAKLVLLLCVVAMLVVPSLASAENMFCPELGEGAGQCGINTHIPDQDGIATDFETGRVYIVDIPNNRVNVFEADGTFVMAFGWGVNTGAAKFESCTTASTCQAGIAGSGAGQFATPRLIAVDNGAGSASHHDIYVIDVVNNRVQKFEPNGTFLFAFGWGVDTGASKLETCTTASTCQAGIAGTGAGQLTSKIGGIGVDGIGVVYVPDSNSIGSAGHNCPYPNQGISYADEFEKRVQKFSGSGGLVEAVTLPDLPCGPLNNLAVDSTGDFYLYPFTKSGIERLNSDPFVVKSTSSGAPLCSIEEHDEVASIAVDAAGNLFVAESARPAYAKRAIPQITQFDSGCNPIRAFGYGKGKKPYGPDLEQDRFLGLALFHGAEGDVFVAQRGIDYLSIPPAGPIVNPVTIDATSVGNVRATLRAEVNPEDKATEVHAEYVDRAHFEEAGFASPATKSTETVPLSVAEGREFKMSASEFPVGCPEATKALIEEEKCLTPETEYRFRVVATNEDNLTGKGEGTAEGTFTTKAPLEIEDTYATDAGTDTVILHAKANPLGIPASGYFEYVDDASFQENGFAAATKAPNVDAAQAPIDFGSAEAPTKRNATLYPLHAGTTYHYRFAVTDPLIEGSRFSEAKAFRTFAPGAAEKACAENEAFRSGASALLPDCRAYEMVSPVDKEGGDIVALPQLLTLTPSVLNQSAVSGEALTFGSYRPFGAVQSAPWTSQYMAERDPEAGWQTHPINPPQGELIKGSAELDFEFKVFSADLCQGWIVPLGEPPLAEGAIPGYYNLYRRTDQICGGEAYEALSAAKPESLPEFANEYQIAPQGFSADGQVAVFAATDSLEGTAAPAEPTTCKHHTVADGGLTICSERLYVKAAGQPPLYACVRPTGEVNSESCNAGTGVGGVGFPLMKYGSVTNALSADGTKIFWSAGAADAPIYLRENPYAPDSAHLHGQAVGTGDLVGPATCTGNLNATTTAKKVKCTSGFLVIGQEITATEAIPAGTTITKIEEPEAGAFTLTLSKAATKVKTGAELTGAGFKVVANAVAKSGAFAAGQEISAGGGLPKGATIAKVEESKPGVFRLTLSAEATRTEVGATLWSSSKCTEVAKACTIAVSRAAEAEAGTNNSHFWAASESGSAAIFTIGSLVEGGGKLYEFEVEGETTKKIADGVYGVVGAGAEASRVYFVSREVLDGEANGAGRKAAKGAPNLYFHEAGSGAGTYRFIGTLAAGDAGTNAIIGTTAVSVEPWTHNGRVSPDGLHAAFMSRTALTGYDNTDAANGEADEEVFVYDATANGGAGELLCASCNPSEARPAGRNTSTANNPYWIAGQIPAYETPLYAPRVLSADGTNLYFESAEALVPRDTNGRIDVYEWERPETGDCDEVDATYSEAAGGCVDLISSGQSKKDSGFVDASPDGHDVFFATLSSLVPQDPGLIDIYDARVGGGFPPPAAPPPACEGEACQSAPEAPNDPTPASEAFQGAGNVKEEPTPTPTASHCAKGKLKRHGKCVAKKHKRTAKRAKPNRRAGR